MVRPKYRELTGGTAVGRDGECRLSIVMGQLNVGLSLEVPCALEGDGGGRIQVGCLCR